MRFLSLVAALFAGCVLAAEVEHPPFITTPPDVVLRMLELAGTGPGDVVYDLGSGDGRIPITAAHRFGARGVGIELDPALVAASRRNAQAAGVQERVSFVHGDVLRADISAATVVTVYLLPSLFDRLQPRLLRELQPGTRIVSHAFGMSGWNSDRSMKMRIAERHMGQGDESTLHLWVVPADARGSWAAGPWRLRIEQNFQHLDIEASLDGRPVRVASPALTGREISWQAEGRRFTGKVDADRMAGELDGAPVVFERR